MEELAPRTDLSPVIQAPADAAPGAAPALLTPNYEIGEAQKLDALRDPAPLPGERATAVKRPRCAFVDPRTNQTCRNQVSVKPCVALGGEPRCSWHDPERRSQQAARQKEALRRARATPAPSVDPGDLPVQEIESLEDALKLARWVPIAIATGILGGREALAMVGALREFRMVAADVSALARLGALEERIAAARKKGLDV